MDFTYTQEQIMMKDAARVFLTKACPNVEWYLDMDKDEKGYTDKSWDSMSWLGWMGIIFPEQYGGIGGSFIDLITLLEEMGRAALPGPYFSTVILAGSTILMAGNDSQKNDFLNKIAEGKLIMTLATLEPEMFQFDPSLILTSAKAKGDDFTINGTKLFVPDANCSDWMIVAARSKDASNEKNGITLFLVNTKSHGIQISPLKTVAGDKQCEVVFNDVIVPKSQILGEIDKGWLYLEKTLEKAAVAKCAEMLGGSEKVMDMVVAYVKERVQFGKPIGSYQAVQHHCANMKILVEQSKYITYKAAWLIDSDDPEASKFSSIAKSFVSEASKRVAQIGHQLFGGTGYIVEHTMPIYSRRAKAGEYAFGNPNYHREIVAQKLGL